MVNLKEPSEYLNDLLKLLTYSTVISDTFTNRTISVANKSIELNYNAGKNNKPEDFSVYKSFVKELHTITIFSTHFQNLVLGIIHDCIMSAHKKGQNESTHQ